LSKTHQVNEEQRSYSIDLELKVHEEDIGKDLMHRQSDDGLLNYLDEEKYDLVCEGGVIFTLG
jgi:CRISPR/Cas system CMR-associated protein Cmr3 (group 5 of RAMP superfamily)